MTQFSRAELAAMGDAVKAFGGAIRQMAASFASAVAIAAPPLFAALAAYGSPPTRRDANGKPRP